MTLQGLVLRLTLMDKLDFFSRNKKAPILVLTPSSCETFKRIDSDINQEEKMNAVSPAFLSRLFHAR